MSDILNKLEKSNDGRDHAMGIGEPRIITVRPVWERHPRLPARDTEQSYAYKTGLNRYKLVAKSVVDRTA